MRNGPREPVRVAVIDSGWRAGEHHPRVIEGLSIEIDRATGLCTRDTNCDDVHGHGTTIARIILDAARDALVHPIKVFGEQLETSPAQLFAALDWVIEQDNFDVVNLSLSTESLEARDPLYALCERLRESGTVVVAAAGNHTNSGYPAVFDNVIGVGLDRGPESHGLRRTVNAEVDFIISCGWCGPPLRRGLSQRVKTTSMAAAFVSGVVARLCAAGPAGAPFQWPAAIEDEFLRLNSAITR